MSQSAIQLHDGDLPPDLDLGSEIAVDCEAMGLNPHRDRLCLVQLTGGDGRIHLVKIAQGQRSAPRLAAQLGDPARLKILHFARFDVALVQAGLGIAMQPVFCTKIASRLVRTYTDKHGLKDLCKELLGIELSKDQQSSDWGDAKLSPEQMRYAAADVLHLHALKRRLVELLAREDRTALAEACFAFLPHRAALDLAGWPEFDIFAH